MRTTKQEMAETSAEQLQTLHPVMRSKGFVWLENNHSTAMYWSHAGRHFEMRAEGDWWCTVEEEDWPTGKEQRDIILRDFLGVEAESDNVKEASRFRVNDKIGDRRNEIVFIGIGMDEDAIRRDLDSCLLDDREFEEYENRWKGFPDPQISFLTKV